MACENTHIYLADRMRGEINDEDLKRILLEHEDFYFLGSIFPDILFYSKDQRMVTVAHHLHGEDGSPTNRIIFDLLDESKIGGDKSNFAFGAGLLSHYAVDIIFHPVVFYFSGYRPNGSKREEERSAYLHTHLEAWIDQQINDRYLLDKAINPDALNDLIIFKILGIDKAAAGQALARQIKYFSINRSRFYYLVFRVLCRLGLFPARIIGGFRENLRKEKTCLPDPIQYKDIITGESRQTTLNDLIDTAVQLGCRMIEAAYRYFAGRLDRGECEKVIAGQSLETGRVGQGTADIRYAAIISQPKDR